MHIFYAFFFFLLLQRGIELIIAQHNERWMFAQGAYEVGKEHYKFFILLHALFFCFLYTEVYYHQFKFTWWSPILFVFFLLAQGLRVWSIMSLGKFWNTKIIILPGVRVVRRGPYKFIRHPNYVVVAIELLVIPLMFQAYVTACLFSVLNAYLLLFIRIPMEENALRKATNYGEVYLNKN